MTHDRRLTSRQVNYLGFDITINAHLRISDSVMDPSTTLHQFRAYLDRHVFFWPTKRDCQKMLDTYMRREPHEAFAVLELNSRLLLSEYFDTVKLSKYDSGSSPRFPTRCSYKKSLHMFLPLPQFETVRNHVVPAKPSEIKEVLVEGKVNDLSRYLQAIYCNHEEDIPKRWRNLARPLAKIRDFDNG